METLGAKVTSIFSILLIAAIITTLVLPDRPTPGVVKAFFDGLTKAVTATIGK